MTYGVYENNLGIYRSSKIHNIIYFFFKSSISLGKLANIQPSKFSNIVYAELSYKSF